MSAHDVTEITLAALNTLPVPNREAIRAELEKALSGLNRKIVVLDDDPTGIQTVHGVSVYTAWDENTVLEGFREESSLFFILTNSRALTAAQTMQIHQDIAKNIACASRLTGKNFLVVSRGDSTLRGHYPP